MFNLDLIWKQNQNIGYWTNDETEFLIESLKKKDLQTSLLDFLSSDKEVNIKKNHKITANIATQPERFDSLLRVLESIEGQFDEIRIYLNNYDYVPQKLQKYTTHIGEDLTDNGKFFWSNNDNEYYFTLDDDIIYPPDYVKKTLPKIKNNIVSYHGHSLIFLGKSYYNDQKVWRFEDELITDTLIDVPGTGVMAFDTDIYKPNLWMSKKFRMTDLLTGLEASLYDISVYCLKRESYWLKSIENYGIWHSSHHSDEEQTKISDMIQINRGVYKFKKPPEFINRQSVEKLIDYISEYNYLNYFQFGFGDGKMFYHIQASEKFKKNKVLDRSIRKRDLSQVISKSLNLKNSFYFTKLIDCKVPKFSVVFLNDYCLPNYFSNKIWQNLDDNCLLFCHHMIDNVVPFDKIEVGLTNGEIVKYYIYKK